MHTLLENEESEELLVHLSAIFLNLSLKKLLTLQISDIISFPISLILWGPQRRGDDCLAFTMAAWNSISTMFLQA